jgi:hypothetical protein
MIMRVIDWVFLILLCLILFFQLVQVNTLEDDLEQTSSDIIQNVNNKFGNDN